ncbi:MAG: DUF4097 family beta strand repeat-containing protein [Pseudomonadota bacterium]
MTSYTRTRTARQLYAWVLMAAAVAVLIFGSANADVNRDSETRVEAFSYEVNGRTVFLGNLAGEITLSAARGDEVEVTATVVAGGRDARDNLALVSFEDETKNGRLVLRTLYPTDEYDTYLYDRDGRGSSRTSFRYNGEKVVVGHGRRVRDGIELHVDYDIKLPVGVNFIVNNGMGQITAEGIDGEFHLKNKSGPVSASNTAGTIKLDTGSGSITGVQHRGDLVADSGSGRVKISDVSGNVLADTGSGSITADNVGGELRADTGSGSVQARNVQGEVFVDTGSGRVTLNDVGGSLSVDTGSGSIDVEDWRGGDELELDTGSGSVSVRGNFANVDRLRVDTGSGSVSLVSSTVPNMKLNVSARPGIDVDFPDMTDVKKSRSSFRGTIGAGSGSGEIDTGSGKVSFRLEAL